MSGDGRKRVVVIGDGETAELAYEYFTYDSDLEVVAFSVESRFLKRESLFDKPVVPFESLESAFGPADHLAFVAVSYTQLNRVRRRLYRAARGKGFSLASYVSSRAFVWRNVALGDNCFIMENNVLQYGVRVGNDVTLWSGNHVGHQSVIRDDVFVSSHVVISGYCEIGEGCFLGVNSCVANNLTIAPDCIVGMGAVITKSTEARGVYRGNPAERAGVDSFKAFKVRDES
jgi:sugar O-acyltransferase (sialic acid O-acetyltransferase NeuD family)